MTLARIDAVETDRHVASALTSMLAVVRRRRRSPSCRRSSDRVGNDAETLDGPPGRERAARRTCRARRTPLRRVTDRPRTHHSAMRSNSASRSASVSTFESRTLLTRRSCGQHGGADRERAGPRAPPDLVDPDDDVVARLPQVALDPERRRVRLQRLAELGNVAAISQSDPGRTGDDLADDGEAGRVRRRAAEVERSEKAARCLRVEAERLEPPAPPTTRRGREMLAVARHRLPSACRPPRPRGRRRRAEGARYRTRAANRSARPSPTRDRPTRSR